MAYLMVALQFRWFPFVGANNYSPYTHGNGILTN